MKTELLSKLPKSIRSIYDAEQMLLALTTTNKFYHLDDRPEDIGIFTHEECNALNRLINEADKVTRRHYGMEGRPECLVGLWEGLIKDQLPLGYICFSAERNPSEVFVYNDNQVVKTSFMDWHKVKSSSWRVEDDSYDESVINHWFKTIT